MNKWIGIGRLTKDGELAYIPGTGTPVMKFTLAVDNYNSKEKKNEADFIPIVLWGKSAENLAQYLVKGTQVAVAGRISTRSYDAKDGSKRYVTEVVAEMYGGVKLLGGKKSETASGSNDVFGGQNFYDDMTPVDDGDMPF